MEPEYQEQRRRKGSRLFAILFVVVIGLVVVGAVTLFQRRAQYQALAKETETMAIWRPKEPLCNRPRPTYGGWRIWNPFGTFMRPSAGSSRGATLMSAR